ncbi:MAG TPA: aminotransferase class III-fold pyridoxal phosphate-dependent enzyme [Nitrospirota bacterium]|nr:aminotransferase class III-fold pyridoxal phosphate-dependent enzyme [Nitrospirota bacterium]
MGKSQDLYKKAKALIPGGTQLLSKRPEMFLPDLWPAYYEKAKGCEVWDLDGNKYIDMITMGIGACILGYSDDNVNTAVKNIIDKGSMSILNAPEEVELAELLCALHPWAGMVRYTRGGGEAVTVAVRIARAKTKKDKVLFCGYHGWHDWYLSANLSEDRALDGHLLPGLAPRGVPRALRGSSYPFVYNDTKGLKNLVDKFKNEIGVIVLEAIRNVEPEKEFINAIMEVTRELGVVFIVDEITSGWRLNLGGAHLLYKIEPDIAVFAKSISNGFPMGAIIGKEEVMEAAQDTFISSTYWTERIGPTAALATIKKLRENNVSNHLVAVGEKIQEGWKTAAAKNGIPIEVSGIYPLSHFNFQGKKPLVLKTLFTQLMLEKGYLASNSFYASYAHKEDHVKGYLMAADEVFSFISRIMRDGKPENYLKGPVCHSGFKRLT